jgi:ankyrin repeat protein
MAAANGHAAAVQLLLRAHATVDAASDHSGTALHCAAEQGHMAVVQLLLEAGAAVEAVTGPSNEGDMYP